MLEKLFTPIILGTGREGRKSEHAARFVLSQAEAAGLATELLDVRDFRIGATGEQHKLRQELSEKLSRADGYIIVSPEYNHSYPGELKMFLDMFYEEYKRKPVGICGVSRGPLGGARAVEQLRLVAIEFHMVPMREAVYFAYVDKLFDASGNITDSSFEEKAKPFFTELRWYANALKTARES